MVRDRTVRARTYVQQQIAVLRYRVDQRDDQLGKRLVLQRVRVAPRITGDCGIRLPDERCGIGKTSAFHVDDARAPGETVVLIANRDVPPPLDATIVVEGGKLPHVGFERFVLHPPIEIQQFRLVIVDDLADAQQPVLQIFGGRRGSAVNVEFVRFGHGRPIEIALLQLLLDIGVEVLAMAHEPPVLGAMVRRGKMQSVGVRGVTQLPQHVAMRTGFEGVPVRQFATVHLIAVMMLGDREVVVRACGGEQIEPLVRIEPFGGEHRNEIPIAELVLWTIGVHVVFEFRVALDVHVA